VQPGENLFRIALQYNMMYTTLAEANNLSYPYTIYTGQVLIIP
jgi:LysM repeat protein